MQQNVYRTQWYPFAKSASGQLEREYLKLAAAGGGSNRVVLAVPVNSAVYDVMLPPTEGADGTAGSAGARYRKRGPPGALSATLASAHGQQHGLGSMSLSEQQESDARYSLTTALRCIVLNHKLKSNAKVRSLDVQFTMVCVFLCLCLCVGCVGCAGFCCLVSLMLGLALCVHAYVCVSAS